MGNIGSVDAKGFIKRDEHCNRVWGVNHPTDRNFPGNGLMLFNLFHPGHGSASLRVINATPEQHGMISEFLFEAIA